MTMKPIAWISRGLGSICSYGEKLGAYQGTATAQIMPALAITSACLFGSRPLPNEVLEQRRTEGLHEQKLYVFPYLVPMWIGACLAAITGMVALSMVH